MPQTTTSNWSHLQDHAPRWHMLEAAKAAGSAKGLKSIKGREWQSRKMDWDN
jgi:hypothetical protein